MIVLSHNPNIMNHKTSIIDIAKKSGFSTTTVSRVLNEQADKYRISKTTQNKIRLIAQELNYVPNEFARNLRTGKTKTIALIIPSLKNHFFAEIASIINSEVKKYDYVTLIGDSDDDVEVEKNELFQFLTKNVDGLIIAPCGEDSIHLAKIQKEGIPLVCIDRYFENTDLSFVSSNNFDGAYNATQYLISQGHKHIACIQGVKHSIPNKQRVAGFLKALSDHKIDSYEISGDAFSEQNGYLEAKLLLQQKNKPTAIFTLSNTIALGCLKAFREEGISLPEEISLITFDENPYLNYMEPSLTCISQPIEDICKIAVKILLSNIIEKDNAPKQILLKTQLKIKESVKNVFFNPE